MAKLAIPSLILGAVILACSTPAPIARRQSPLLPRSSALGARPAVDSSLGADDGQWVMPAKDYASTRFSGLDEVSTTTVSRLRLAWTFSTGLERGHEAPPLVVGTVMYLITPYPNTLYAFDLSQPGGVVKWKYQPSATPFAQGVACCDVVNRGAAYDGGMVYFNTLDGQTVAVDASTGKERWKTKVGDINRGETITMAPLVVKGMVLVGNSGGEMGVRGWLIALDARTGKERWRAYHTGPDKDVLIGPRFKPFYPGDRGVDLGVSTWPGTAWQTGGGAAWGWISYDRDLDLVYYGTGNPGPWNPEMRPGDNKWTATGFARDPDTGEAVWAYQWSPHDLFDYDGVNEMVLLDLPIGGRTRKVLVHPGREGYVYVLDRQTGEVLSADPYGYITTTAGVDLTTGRPVEVKAKAPRVGTVVRHICPAAPGAKDWQPSAWSPLTGLLYIPHQNLCQDEEIGAANYIAGTPYLGATVKMYPGPGGHRGVVTAWDPVGRKTRWEVREDFPVWSGALATAGGVVFYGTMDGWFKALDARTGALLWRYKTESGIVGQPMTYRAPDGKQYVAIVAGVGGWAGAIVSAGLDARDSSAALGFVNAVKDLPSHTSKGGRLYVFGLP